MGRLVVLTRTLCPYATQMIREVMLDPNWEMLKTGWAQKLKDLEAVRAEWSNFIECAIDKK